MLLQRPEPEADALLAEARSTTRRVGRTFALACRLLPADVRDDVYRLYLVFRTLDDLVDERRRPRPGRRRRRRGVVRGRLGAARARRRVLADLATRHDLPRHALRDFCHGMRDDLEGRPVRTEADVDRYCYRVAGTVGIVMAAVLGTTTARAPTARPRRSGWRCSARTSCATSTRTARSAAATSRRRRSAASAATCAPAGARRSLRDQIARADALYDEGVAGIGAAPPGPLRDRRGRRHVPRDPAPDRARGLRRARGPRRGLGARASSSSPRGRGRARPDRGGPVRTRRTDAPGVAAPGAGARLAVPA